MLCNWKGGFNQLFLQKEARKSRFHPRYGLLCLYLCLVSKMDETWRERGGVWEWECSWPYMEKLPFLLLPLSQEALAHRSPSDHIFPCVGVYRVSSLDGTRCRFKNINTYSSRTIIILFWKRKRCRSISTTPELHPAAVMTSHGWLSDISESTLGTKLRTVHTNKSEAVLSSDWRQRREETAQRLQPLSSITAAAEEPEMQSGLVFSEF